MKNLNQLIKSFDYSIEHRRKFIELLNEELKTLPTVIVKFDKGRAIYRCRKHDNFKNNFYFEKDISYRTDISNIRNFGRCNRPGSSKFYCATDSPDIQQGHVVAVFETSDMLQNGSINGIERYTIGKWISKEEIQLMAIKPPEGLVKDSAIYRHLIETFNVYYNDENFTDDHKEFYELVGLEFSKLVKENENYKYYISAMLSERLLMHDKIDGIIYPSVQSDCKGLNIVLNPKKFDQFFQIEKVLVGDLYVFSMNSIFNNVLLCDNAVEYPFIYTEIPDGNSLNIDQIIQFFENKNINSRDIINSFIEQISRL